MMRFNHQAPAAPATPPGPTRALPGNPSHTGGTRASRAMLAVRFYKRDAAQEAGRGSPSPACLAFEQKARRAA